MRIRIKALEGELKGQAMEHNRVQDGKKQVGESVSDEAGDDGYWRAVRGRVV